MSTMKKTEKFRMHSLVQILTDKWKRPRSSACANRSKTQEQMREIWNRCVRSACDGEASCELYANNGVFGDPCGGTYKYLKVTSDYTPGT